jgi:ubiquinone/menaquinone biosynthesis C-methylase UbiE
MPALSKQPEDVTRTFYRDQAVVEEYDQARFGSPGGRALNALQLATIRSVIGESDLQGTLALEVGSGSGRFTELLADQGASVLSLDTSRGMLAVTRRRVPSTGPVLGDALTLPFADRTFGLSLSVWVYNHLSNHDEAIGELCRVTDKSVVLGLPNLGSLYVLPYLARRLRLSRVSYTVRRYQGTEAPPSYYFRRDELVRVLAGHGFEIDRWETTALLPLVPSPIARAYPRLDALLRRGLGKYGSFLAVSASRRH